MRLLVACTECARQYDASGRAVGSAVGDAGEDPPEALAPSSRVRARPKSMSLAPAFVIITLPGFRSR